MWHLFLLLYFVIFSIVVTFVINDFCWISMRSYFFTYIFFVHYFVIDTNNLLYISLFLQSNWCIKWTFVLKVYMSKFWISYNIITFLCIQIIWFNIVDVWVNSSTSPLFRLVKNVPSVFYSWRRKRNNYFFYFCKIVLQYNQNKTWKLRRRSIPLASSIDWSSEKCNYLLNCIYKIIGK